MKNPAKVKAGRKGGKAAYQGKKGFAADTKRASSAGRKGALGRWRKPKPAPPTGPSKLEKYKLEFEPLPSEPKPKRGRKPKK